MRLQFLLVTAKRGNFTYPAELVLLYMELFLP